MKHFLRLKWDFLVIVILLGGALAFSFRDAKWVIRADNPHVQGSRPPDRFVGDILLLTPESPPDRATTFSELDTSYAWYNALWQRYGSFASARVSELSPELLAGRLALIVPNSVAKNMSIEGMRAIENATKAGIFTIVEMPTENWSNFLHLRANSREKRQATYAQLKGGIEIPLTGERILLEPLDPDYQTHFKVDGEYGYLSRAVGKGRVFSLAFHAGANWIALQQGLPSKGMRFSKKTIHNGQRGSLPSPRPLADLLENAIFEAVESYRPTPRFSPFPHSYKGAISIVHPRFARDTSTRVNTKPGTLMWANFDDSDHLREGEERYCIWSTQRPNMFNTRYFNTPYLPLFQELDLGLQLEHCKVTMAQDMSWKQSWLGDLKKVAVSDAVLDLSFGPAPESEPGFVFGTGFPFYPITREGLALPLLLQPLIFTNARQLRELPTFIKNENIEGQILGVSFPTDEMKKRPDAQSLIVLKEISDIAKKENYWLSPPLEIAYFLSSRRRSVLSSQWSPFDQRLVISLKIAPSAYPLSLRIPASYQGEPLESILLDNKAQKIKSKHKPRHYFLELSEGRHKIEVRYRKPEENLDPPP